jgi:hypothetical protein
MAADERQHRPGEDPLWGESWSFEFTTPDGGLGGYVRLGVYPQRNVCWYWACVVGEGRRLVTVIDHDVPLPRRPLLEIRAEGLWADHIIETPFDHVTVGCEAFGLALDDPAEVFGPMLGERVPFGLDLEWETDGAVYLYPPGHLSGTTRYELPCRVHGEVLVGDERIELDGMGQRHHAWGTEDWWEHGWTSASGRLTDGTCFHGMAVHRNDGTKAATLYHAGYVQRPSDTPQPNDGPSPGVHGVVGTTRGDDQGFPASAELTLGGLQVEIDPVAFAPVLVEAPGGRTSRLIRALCRYRDAGGRSGTGWTEWNRPLPVSRFPDSE